MIPELAGAVHTVEVLIEDIRDIANTTLPNAETDATHSSSSFKNLTLDKGAFGDSPLGRELAHQHQAAHDVFKETIAGVIADLQDFRQNLLDCMKNHETTDESAQATLLALGRKYHGHTYNSDTRYDEGLHQNAEGLTTSNTNAKPEPAVPVDPAANKPHVAPAPGAGGGYA